MSLPIITYKMPKDASYNSIDICGTIPSKDGEIEVFPLMPYKNPGAQMLNLDAAVASLNWGKPCSQRWEKAVGNVMVMRADGLDITPKQVEAITIFCQHKLAPVMTDHNAITSGQEDVLDEWKILGQAELQVYRSLLMEQLMCQCAFERFLQRFRAGKLKGGDGSWKDVESPFGAGPHCLHCGMKFARGKAI